MLDAANQITKAAYKEGLTAEAVLDTAEKAVFRFSVRRLTRQVLPIRNIVSTVYDHVEMASSNDTQVFVQLLDILPIRNHDALFAGKVQRVRGEPGS